jgi:ABC-type transport system involved in multi-copper enzyme maturation permease subunit
MSAVGTLLRLELGQTFRSPLAYVFLVLFVVLSQVFFVLGFFQAGRADIRPFFHLLPWLVVAFSALVTMRSWAEERQANTYEMLLTFPVRDRDLVWAKFLSALCVLAIALGCTLLLPVMLFAVGDPDPGPVVTGYLGSLLLAAMWCAAGVFFSGLTRSQLLAALISLVAGVVCLLLGTGVVAQGIDAKAPGLGTLLLSLFGIGPRFDAFTRGVVDLADAGFFVAWTLVFVCLNALFVSERRRSDAGAVLAVGALLAIGCGLSASRLLHDTSAGRADWTEERLYTLSDATVRIFERAEVPVQATLYVSPPDEMTTGFRSLEQEVVDRLDEIRAATGGKLQFRVIHVSASAAGAAPRGEDEPALRETDRPLEQRLEAKGVRPFGVQELKAAERTVKRIYATLAIAYREKDEDYVHRLEPRRLDVLEYEIARSVARLTRDRPPRVVVVPGPMPMRPEVAAEVEEKGIPVPVPYQQAIELLHRERFDVVTADLSVHEPLPDEYDALVVLGPSGFDRRQNWELNRALGDGKPTLLAVQRYDWLQMPTRTVPRPLRLNALPDVDEVLAAQGVGVAFDMLLDVNHQDLNLPLEGARRGGRPALVKVASPTHVLVPPTGMSKGSGITRGVSTVLYQWGTPLDLDLARMQTLDLRHEVLLSSSEKSWLVPAKHEVLTADDQYPAGKDAAARPLVALIEGRFRDAFPGAPRPEWPYRAKLSPEGLPLPIPHDTEERPADPRPGRLILTGSAAMFRDGFLGNPGNAGLLVNCVHALTLDEDLLRVRGKQRSDRRFEKPSEGAALLWTLATLGLVPLSIVGTGLGVGIARRRARRSWNAAHGR